MNIEIITQVIILLFPGYYRFLLEMDCFEGVVIRIANVKVNIFQSLYLAKTIRIDAKKSNQGRIRKKSFLNYAKTESPSKYKNSN